MEMEDQYGMPDLRHLMNGSSRSHFPTIPQHPVDLFSSHRNLTPPDHHHHHHHYEMLMVAGRQAAATVGHDHLGALPRGLHEYHHDTTTTATSAGGGGSGAGGGGAAGGSTATITVTATSSGTLSGLETEGGCIGGGDGGTGRWPRQETLTLLEIRSRLDHKFKEANQKGPLWDEVSRIMSEEHGYQRSGKKCREKFENLYKYYKKTKEGKAGRQDGKHYRFFRQLEALYGETNNNNNNPVTLVSDQSHIVPFHHSGIISNNISSSSQPNNIQESNFQALHQKLCTDSLSLSNNSSEFDSSSSDDHNDDPNYANAYIEKDENLAEKMSRKRRGRRSWKAKIKEFIDTQMRRLMEKQEAWLEKMMKTIENKERERMMREEEWKKQEAARLEREHKFWANERAWIEARDAALMEALQKLKGKDIKAASTRADELMLMPAELLRNFGENQNENNAGVENNNTSSTNGGGGDGCWPETEITRLIQLRLGMDSRFQQCGCSEEDLWEEIATKMACLGYERNAITCKEKWDNINNYMIRRSNKENGKKRKENSRSGCYYQNSGSDSMYNQGGETYVGDINGQVGTEIRLDLDQPNGGGSSPTVASNSNAGNNGVQESCFRFLMGSDGENLWENYGVRLNNKGENP